MSLFLPAVGLTIIFGVLRVLNFAHGSFYMLGAITLFIFSTMEGLLGNFWISAIIATGLVGGLGGVIERTLISRLYDAEVIYQLLLTLGISLVLSNGVRIGLGESFHSVSVPKSLAFTFNLGGTTIPAYNIFIIFVGLLISFLIWIWFNKTKTGKIMMAVSEDTEVMSSHGINVPNIYTKVFIIGSILAGFAGVLAGPFTSIHPAMGDNILLNSFIIVIIGGLGSFVGAFMASILVGFTTTFMFIIFPKGQVFVPFLIMIIVLILRPKGLKGEVEI